MICSSPLIAKRQKTKTSFHLFNHTDPLRHAWGIDYPLYILITQQLYCRATYDFSSTSLFRSFLSQRFDTGKHQPTASKCFVVTTARILVLSHWSVTNYYRLNQCTRWISTRVFRNTLLRNVPLIEEDLCWYNRKTGSYIQIILQDTAGIGLSFLYLLYRVG